MKKLLLIVVMLVMVIGIGGFNSKISFAESMYEYYANATPETLDSETKTMGQALKQTFSQENIHKNQQKIDFATYFTNLKKATLYGKKLSTYSQYQKDLGFARDNELFKGLPEASHTQISAAEKQSRQEFVAVKYERTKLNVEDEIEIYLDLLTLALDVCESMSVNDLSGFLELEENRAQVRKWQQGEQFTGYKNKQSDLLQGWPDIERRIAAQYRLWQGRGASPEAPIVNARLLEQL